MLLGQTANDLFNRLKGTWGKSIISGQCGRYDDIKKTVGKEPAIQGFDFQNYSPHNPWHDDWSSWDDGTVQKAIDWYKKTGGKGIVTFQWHWFSPTGGNLRTSTFYTSNTNFDVSKGVQQGTSEYNAIIRDIDAIASQLKRLKDAGIPVLFRPLHEAGGKWFWWGAKGADACKKLYSIMRDRIINHHGINNLIWVWSTPEQDWYPGNNNVDILGFDSYPGKNNYDCNQAMFNNLKSISGGQKLLVLSENGPIPNIGDCFSKNAKWGYFVGWNDNTFNENDVQHIKDVYNDGRVKKLGEL